MIRDLMIPKNHYRSLKISVIMFTVHSIFTLRINIRLAKLSSAFQVLKLFMKIRLFVIFNWHSIAELTHNRIFIINDLKPPKAYSRYSTSTVAGFFLFFIFMLWGSFRSVYRWFDSLLPILKDK